MGYQHESVSSLAGYLPPYQWAPGEWEASRDADAIACTMCEGGAGHPYEDCGSCGDGRGFRKGVTCEEWGTLAEALDAWDRGEPLWCWRDADGVALAGGWEAIYALEKILALPGGPE